MSTPNTPSTPHDDALTDEVFVEEHPTRELPAAAEADAGSTGAPAPQTSAPPPQAGAPTATMPVTQGSPSATPATPATAATPATPATAATPATPSASVEPTYLRGPAPFAIVLGLLGLVVAGVTLVAELTDLTVPWDDLGPWTVVGAGLVVLLVGAIGLRASRPQD